MGKGQISMVVIVFATIFVGLILAVASASLYSTSSGNFTGISATIGSNIVPLFLLLLLIVPIAAVALMFGKGR